MSVKRTSSQMGGGAPSTRRIVRAKRTVIGNVGGKIPASRSTLAQAKSPFGTKREMTFLYENELTALAAATSQIVSVMSNSLFDFDQSGLFGNKQPLFYDAMLSAAGPYRQYRVKSWKTTYTVMNNTASPITVWAIPPVSATAEIDSAAEADNFPGTKSLYLGSVGTSKDSGTITVYGHVDDVYGANADLDTLTGNYNANPNSPCYQGIYVKAADGSTALSSVYVAVRHEAYTTLGLVDAIVS